MDFEPALQAEALAMAQSLWNTLGIGPLEILASYTLGHDTPQVARRLGIKAINSLCTCRTGWMARMPINGGSTTGLRLMLRIS